VAVPRLILIEGMIGSGKTTTARYLADWLSRHGEDVRAFDEGAADHPIRTRRVDELLAGEDVRAFDEGAADHPIRTRRVDELLASESQ